MAVALFLPELNSKAPHGTSSPCRVGLPIRACRLVSTVHGPHGCRRPAPTCWSNLF